MPNRHIWGMVAAAFLAMSAFLPWISIEFLTYSDQITGIESGDGWLVVSFAIVAGLLHWIQLRWALVPGVLALALGVYDLYDLYQSSLDSEIINNKGMQLHIQYGFYLLLLAAIGVIVTAILPSHQRDTQSVSDGLT